MPISADIKPIVLPITTSKGKWAPTPTLENAIIKPSIRIEKVQNILDFSPLGINANNNIVIIVKVIMECPEGKLECVDAIFLPIIIKVSLSSTAAGLGTANSFFKKNDNSPEMIEEVNTVCQSLGA